MAKQPVPTHSFDYTQQKPHLSTKLASDILRYIRVTYPGVEIEKICSEANLSMQYILDEDKWLSISSFKRLIDKVIEVIGDDELRNTDFHFKLGQFSVKNASAGKTVQFLAKNILPMSFVYGMLPKLASLFSQISKTSILSHTNGNLKIRLEPDLSRHPLTEVEKKEVLEFFELIFYNTLGYYTAIPVNYEYPPAQASFERFETGDKTPYYEINIEYPKTKVFDKSLGFYLLVGGAFIAALMAFLLKIVSALPFIFFSLFLAVAFFTIDLARTKSRLKERFEASLTALESYDQRYTKLHQAHLDKEQLLVSYKKFVPFEYLKLLNVKDIFRLERGQAVQVEASLLFCDIRRFTSISEKMTPQENFNFLNLYFEKVAPIIQEEGGFIDKYIGDELLAIFPPSGGGALFAAVKIQRALESFNVFAKKNGIPEIEVGIGISTGQVMVGTVGIDQHMQVTVISDAVNTASRLQEMTKKFRASAIACGVTVRKASAQKEDLPVRYLGEFALRGKENPIKTFEVFHDLSSQHAQKSFLNRKITDSAISLIEQKYFELSKQLFLEALQNYPNDPLIHHYLSCIDEFLASPANVRPVTKAHRDK